LTFFYELDLEINQSSIDYFSINNNNKNGQPTMPDLNQLLNDNKETLRMMFMAAQSTANRSLNQNWLANLHQNLSSTNLTIDLAQSLAQPQSPLNDKLSPLKTNR
jgi:hypothetical protein